MVVVAAPQEVGGGFLTAPPDGRTLAALTRDAVREVCPQLAESADLAHLWGGGGTTEGGEVALPEGAHGDAQQGEQEVA